MRPSYGYVRAQAKKTAPFAALCIGSAVLLFLIILNQSDLRFDGRQEMGAVRMAIESGLVQTGFLTAPTANLMDNDSNVSTSGTNTDTRPDISNQFGVKVISSTTLAQASSTLTAQGAVVLRDLVHLHALVVTIPTPALVSTISHDPFVSYVERAYYGTTYQGAFGVASTPQRTGPVVLSNPPPRTSGARVAIIDNGAHGNESYGTYMANCDSSCNLPILIDLGPNFTNLDIAEGIRMATDLGAKIDSVSAGTEGEQSSNPSPASGAAGDLELNTASYVENAGGHLNVAIGNEAGDSQAYAGITPYKNTITSVGALNTETGNSRDPELAPLPANVFVSPFSPTGAMGTSESTPAFSALMAKISAQHPEWSMDQVAQAASQAPGIRTEAALGHEKNDPNSPVGPATDNKSDSPDRSQDTGLWDQDEKPFTDISSLKNGANADPSLSPADQPGNTDEHVSSGDNDSASGKGESENSDSPSVDNPKTNGSDTSTDSDAGSHTDNFDAEFGSDGSPTPPPTEVTGDYGDDAAEDDTSNTDLGGYDITQNDPPDEGGEAGAVGGDLGLISNIHIIDNPERSGKIVITPSALAEMTAMWNDITTHMNSNGTSYFTSNAINSSPTPALGSDATMLNIFATDPDLQLIAPTTPATPSTPVTTPANTTNTRTSSGNRLTPPDRPSSSHLQATNY